jgi:hypothetical protein
MRLLLDECVPKRLKDDLLGHDVRHVVEMGWSSKRNGELLELMVAEHFEALLTVDQEDHVLDPALILEDLRAAGFQVLDRQDAFATNLGGTHFGFVVARRP